MIAVIELRTLHADTAGMASLPLTVMVNMADLADLLRRFDVHVCEQLQPLVVKISAINPAGTVVDQVSGFLYSALTEGIVTASHGTHPACGPDNLVFRARYSDGFEEPVQRIRYTANNFPDVAIMRGSRRAPFSLGGMPCIPGDTVYALGYSNDFMTPCFSKGNVVNGTIGSVAVTSHADHGYSGGPVINCEGRLVGIIKGPLGNRILQVGLTPAQDVHTFLIQAGEPGLTG